jgi:hemolysin activation/secretion protein
MSYRIERVGRVARFGWYCLAGLAVVGLCSSSLAAPADVKAGAQSSLGGGLGQEMKSLEKEILKPSVPPKKAKPEITLEDKTQTNKFEAIESIGKKEGYKIAKLEVRGDIDFLKTAGLYEEIRKKTEGQYLTDAEIQALVRKSNKSLIDAGYYLASLWAPPADYAKGILILQVDKGRIGKKTFYQATTSAVTTGKVATAAVKKPFKGKYYSEAQLSRRLEGLKEGDTFDYRSFYSSVYNINALPDVTMDTDLKVRKVQNAGLAQRLVDMDFTVEDRMPIHGALSVGNSGTKATGDWRPSAMVQDLNLTKHDDILTLNFGPVSPNLQDLTSFGASYYLPNNWKNGGAFTLYGGYSDLDAQDVVQGVNVRGQGWFTGAQQSYKLISTEKHLLSMSLGITYRVMEDQLILTQEGQSDWPLDKRQVTMVPLSMALSYSSGQPDFIGGRNFITSQTSGHQAGLLGASSEEDIQTLRVNADGDYYIERLQVARIQPLSGEQKGSLGWLLFAKADGQLASGPLVPAEQKAIGGMDSVRGFPERIVQGDDGISGTLELRTPLMSTFWGSPYKTKADRDRALNEGKTTDRLQFVTFVDAGSVQIKDSISSVDSYTIAGAGAGFRLAMTKYSQFRFDWGIPIMGKSDVETKQEKIASGGRYHLSAQVQF